MVRTPTADKMATNLVALKEKHEKAKNLAVVGGLVFWAFTGLTGIYMFSDVEAFFTSAERVQVLMWWTLPAAFFVIASRRADAALAEWKDLKKAAIQKLNPEFCSHQMTCRCRQDFLEEMKQKGIDLY